MVRWLICKGVVMALTPSGTISMSDINSALGRSPTAEISFNDSQVRFLANQDAGSVSMNAMQNKYNFMGTITPGYYDFLDGRSYGYILGYMGSITGTIFDGTSPAMFTGYDTINSVYYAYVESYTTSSVFPNITMRLKVGSNQINSMYRGNYYGTTATWSYFQTAQVIFSSDVGVTQTWQFSQA